MFPLRLNFEGSDKIIWTEYIFCYIKTGRINKALSNKYFDTPKWICFYWGYLMVATPQAWSNLMNSSRTRGILYIISREMTVVVKSSANCTPWVWDVVNTNGPESDYIFFTCVETRLKVPQLYTVRLHFNHPSSQQHVWGQIYCDNLCCGRDYK